MSLRKSQWNRRNRIRFVGGEPRDSQAPGESGGSRTIPSCCMVRASPRQATRLLVSEGDFFFSEFGQEMRLDRTLRPHQPSQVLLSYWGMRMEERGGGGRTGTMRYQRLFSFIHQPVCVCLHCPAEPVPYHSLLVSLFPCPSASTLEALDDGAKGVETRPVLLLSPERGGGDRCSLIQLAWHAQERTKYYKRDRLPPQASSVQPWRFRHHPAPKR